MVVLKAGPGLGSFAVANGVELVSATTLYVPITIRRHAPDILIAMVPDDPAGTIAEIIPQPSVALVPD